MAKLPIFHIKVQFVHLVAVIAILAQVLPLISFLTLFRALSEKSGEEPKIEENERKQTKMAR